MLRELPGDGTELAEPAEVGNGGGSKGEGE